MRLTRAFHEDFVHTIPTRPAPSHALLGDEWPEPHMEAGAIEGGKHREPVGATVDRMPEPDGWFTAVIGVGCIAAVAACALLVMAFT